MFDYRQKRRPSVAKSRSASRASRNVVQPVSRRHPGLAKRRAAASSPIRRPAAARNKPRSTDSKTSLLIKAIGSVVLAVAVIALCAYFFMTRIATHLWPLTTVQTVMLVPAESATNNINFIQVLVLDPETQTANLAELSSSVPLTMSGELRVGDLSRDVHTLESSPSGMISLKLGRLVDDVVALPNDEPVRTHAQAKRVFQQLVNSETPRLSWSQKFRWWLFTLSLDDTDWRVKNIGNYSNWQSWLASVAQQQPVAGCSLALINTTPTSGLSRFTSQVMEQSGYQVIRVDSQPKFLEKSQLFISPERLQCLTAAERLQRFLPEKVQVVQDSSVTGPARADIVWLLGNDLAQQASVVIGKN